MKTQENNKEKSHPSEHPQGSINSFLGSTLRELRTQRNLTQKEVAEQLNVTDALLSAYELGKTIPDLNTLIRLSDIFNVDPLVLIGKSIEKSKYYQNPILELPLSDYSSIIDELSKIIEKHRNLRREQIINSLQETVCNIVPNNNIISSKKTDRHFLPDSVTFNKDKVLA